MIASIETLNNEQLSEKNNDSNHSIETMNIETFNISLITLHEFLVVTQRLN